MPGGADKNVAIFVGPTLATSARAHALIRPLRRHPPAERGAIGKLVAMAKRPGVLVLVDGLFHERLAVGHAELREALDQGWQVWGLSSMGAIRAREMAPLGMRGFGRVYERFNEDDDFQDDEVALLHEPTAPYRPLTEPLVHLRTAIEHLVRCGVIKESVGRAVVGDLKSRWFGERTIRCALDSLVRHAGAGAETKRAIQAQLAEFDRFRLKTIDLVEFLEARPWFLDAIE
jgi:hypothetical protein